MSKGSLKTIAGPMYAGKTSALLQSILWANHCNNSVIVLKPAIDTRYSQTAIQTHNQLSYSCFAMHDWNHALANVVFADYDSIYLDEVQFMDTSSTVEQVSRLIIQGKNVVAAGLNQDSGGRPFETTAMLMAISDEVKLISAICNVCGRPATRTHRLADTGDRVMVGSMGIYEPRCNDHWEPRV